MLSTPMRRNKTSILDSRTAAAWNSSTEEYESLRDDSSPPTPPRVNQFRMGLRPGDDLDEGDPPPNMGLPKIPGGDADEDEFAAAADAAAAEDDTALSTNEQHLTN